MWRHLGLHLGLLACLLGRPVMAGIRYEDPAGGWRYTLDGTLAPGVAGLPDGYGLENDTQSLDGTWNHDQSDKWDGTAPGDPISDPTVEPLGPSPGGVGALTEGDTTYLRLQDTGNPEWHGWQQGNDDPENTNRRLYFGHELRQDGPLSSELVLDNGITISLRARIPVDGPLDDAYLRDEEDNPVVIPWGDAPRGYPLHDEGRGMFGVVQNDSDFFDQDGQISFSLLSAADIAAICESGTSNNFELCDEENRSGGLIMNNLRGGSATSHIDTFDDGGLNILEISDDELVKWHEFWITIEQGGSGTHQVKIYLDGSDQPAEFDVTSSSDGNAEYLDDAWLTMGLSSTGLFGAVDVDFFSYTLGVVTPVPKGPSVACDLNGDQAVDAADAGLMFGNWGQPGIGDCNNDGIVDAADAGIMFSEWTGDAPATIGVPEPSTPLLLLFGSSLLTALYRRRVHRN